MILTGEKDYRKYSFIVFYFTQPQNTKSIPIYIAVNSRNSCLATRIHPVQLKKIIADILHKIHTEKAVITDIRLILSTLEARKEFNGFQVATC